jgi:hypothetical protein
LPEIGTIVKREPEAAVSVTVDHQEYTTRIAAKSRNPQWIDESFIVYVPSHAH